MGIPFEIITMLGSTILSGVMSLWGMKIKQQEKMNSFALNVAKLNQEDRSEAREVTDGGVQWTRRLIALSTVGAVIVLPKVVVLMNPEVLITFGWTHMDPGFLFFSGKEALTWKTATGVVITPLDTHLVSSIAGLYFGSSIVGHQR